MAGAALYREQLVGGWAGRTHRPHLVARPADLAGLQQALAAPFDDREGEDDLAAFRSHPDFRSAVDAWARADLARYRSLGPDARWLVRDLGRASLSGTVMALDAMGKDGIALQVLTQKLPLINEEINKILSSACEFGVYIEYEPEDQSIRLYIQYGQYKSRLLELGSGAEKFIASVAIRSALLSISNLPRSNMFIIDEGFGKLDPQNLEAIQRIFDYLKSVFDHVIVISHTETMKDMVDNIIDITSDDEGYAHVEIGG